MGTSPNLGCNSIISGVSKVWGCGGVSINTGETGGASSLFEDDLDAASWARSRIDLCSDKSSCAQLTSHYFKITHHPSQMFGDFLDLKIKFFKPILAPLRQDHPSLGDFLHLKINF